MLKLSDWSLVSLQGSERANALARIKYKSYSAVVEVGAKFEDWGVFVLNWYVMNYYINDLPF